MSDTYFNKYMKYKKKYLELKSNAINSGGNEECNKIIDDLVKDYENVLNTISDESEKDKEKKRSLRIYLDRVKNDMLRVNEICSNPSRYVRTYKRNINKFKDENTNLFSLITDEINDLKIN